MGMGNAWRLITPTDEDGVEITVTRSAGNDRAVLVLIDTTFEPDASDGGPGLRVLINDDEAYVGKAYEFGGRHRAGERTVVVALSEVAYDDGGGA